MVETIDNLMSKFYVIGATYSYFQFMEIFYLRYKNS